MKMQKIGFAVVVIIMACGVVMFGKKLKKDITKKELRDSLVIENLKNSIKTE